LPAIIASNKPANGLGKKTWGRVEQRMIPEGITQIRVGREPRSGERGGIRKQGMRYVSGYFRSGDRGIYWASGRAGLVDLVAAHKWFNLAALKGRKDAVALRQEVAGQMSDAEISAAQRDARAWVSTH
jgi:hypothetical protein